MSEALNFSEKACEILQATNDGNDLTPEDLYLLQGAVNGGLTFIGDVAFVNLHQQVIKGEYKYKKPWLHGVEHLTIDHEGFVYWKGHHVEHFTPRFIGGMREQSQELGRWCQILEDNGIKISVGSAVWNYEIIERALYNELEVN